MWLVFLFSISLVFISNLKLHCFKGPFCSKGFIRIGLKNLMLLFTMSEVVAFSKIVS